MNHLNSTLVEGTAVGKPMLHTANDGAKTLTFTIESKRFFTNGTGICEEISNIEVQTEGKMAELIQSKFCEGREIRIVGRIRQDRQINKNGELEMLPRHYVIPEHFELKPDFKYGKRKNKEIKV